MSNKIEIFGARENNLKNIDLEFKKNNLVVIRVSQVVEKVLWHLILSTLKVKEDTWKVSQLMLDPSLEI